MKKTSLVGLALVMALAMNLGAVVGLPAPAAASVPAGTVEVQGGNITLTSDLGAQAFSQLHIYGNLSVKLGEGVEGPYNLNYSLKILDPGANTTMVGTGGLSAYVNETNTTTQAGTVVFWGTLSLLHGATLSNATYSVDASTNVTFKPSLSGYITCDSGTTIWEFTEMTPLSTGASLVGRCVTLITGVLDNFVINVNLGDAIHPFWRPQDVTSLGSTLVNGIARMVADAVDVLAGIVGLLAAPATVP